VTGPRSRAVAPIVHLVVGALSDAASGLPPGGIVRSLILTVESVDRASTCWVRIAVRPASTPETLALPRL